MTQLHAVHPHAANVRFSSQTSSLAMTAQFRTCGKRRLCGNLAHLSLYSQRPLNPPAPPGTPSLTRFQPLERIKDYPIMREPSNAHIASNSFSASIPPYKLLILLMRYGMTFRVRLSRLIDEDRSAHVGWTAGTSPALGP